MRRRAFACAVLVGTGLVLGAGCDPRGTSPAPSVDGFDNIEPEFVGGAVCAACHPGEHARWQASHHAQSMRPARADSVLGDFDGARFTDGAQRVEFTRRDGAYFVRMTDVASGGAVVEHEIKYTFGFAPLQQYLVELDGGRLHALTLAWDARDADAGGQRWLDLQAGEPALPGDALHWTGALYNWNERCAACHSTHLEKRYDAAADVYATTFSSVNVDCEACHGPGSAHVAEPSTALHLSASVRAAWVLDEQAIARAEALHPERNVELETCAACHSRRAQVRDLQVGTPFADTFELALLVEPLYFADGQILDEVFVYGSFLQSAMHAAGVTCTDCHDAHSGALRSSGDALCARCHRADVFTVATHHNHRDGPQVPQCVDCHMPARTYMQIDPRRDHSLRVPRPDLSVALGVPNACNTCHADQPAQWAAAHVARWFPSGHSTRSHYAEALAAGRNWSADRSARLTQLALDTAAPAIVRATSVELLARQLDGPALDALAVVLDSASEPLLQIAALRALANVEPALKPRLGQRFLDHPRASVRIAAANALFDARAALSPARQADLDAARAEYAQMLEYSAGTAESRHGLGLLAEQRGELERAEAQYRSAIAASARHAPAYVNLADLYRRTSREAEGRALLEDASLAVLGDVAAVHLALGLARTRAGAVDAAVESLARAAELAPDDPYYAYAHALGLDAVGDRDAALRELRASHERFPGYAPILIALATRYRDAGDRGTAIEYTERLLAVAPGDASGLALRAELQAAR